MKITSRSRGIFRRCSSSSVSKPATPWLLSSMAPRSYRKPLRTNPPNLPLTLEPNMVSERVEGPFGDEPPVERAAQPLHLKILLTLSPAKPQESVLKPEDAT